MRWAARVVVVSLALGALGGCVAVVADPSPSLDLGAGPSEDAARPTQDATSSADAAEPDAAEADAALAPDGGTTFARDAEGPADDATSAPSDASPADVPTADVPTADAGPPSSVGCARGAGLTEGEHSFMLDGRARRYLLRLPTGYTPARAWPVVLALHGNGGSAAYWDVTSGARNIRAALRSDAILVIVEAIDGNWRDYAQPASTWPARIDLELAYFEHVLTELRGALCVREDAIFSMGFSGGGSFSGLLACRRTDIRAIAVGGSVLYYDPAACVGRAAAWVTIGDQESTVDRQRFRDDVRARAGCLATDTATTPAGCVAYDGCPARTPVQFCAHPGGHEWPSFGSQAMAAFFRAVLR